MRKRFLIVFLVSILCFLVTGCNKKQKTINFTGMGFSLSLASDTNTFRASIEHDQYMIIIPSEYNGKPVTSVYCNKNMSTNHDSKIYKIYLPDSIINIEDRCFSRCSNLTSIEIPDNVTIIGRWAFYNCSNLTSVTIGNSVVIIGDSAFSDCSSLTNITIPESVTSIGDSAFSGCSSFTSITIPNSVTSIGNRAFYNCSNLTNVTIPDSVTSIGYDVFDNCAKIEKISLPINVLSKIPKQNLKEVDLTSGTSIGNKAFDGCIKLERIIIPNSVKSIDAFTFSDCSTLKEVYYKGTSNEWNNVIIDYKVNKNLRSALIYYYSEIKPTTSGYYWHYVDGVVTKW